MVPYFPRQISIKAVIVYIAALSIVSIAYSSFSMDIRFITLGCLWVIGFFTLLEVFSSNWNKTPERRFARSVFSTAMVLRVAWVLLSYYFYISVTGIPFEFDTADAYVYHLDAEWMAGEDWAAIRQYLFNILAISDSGYPLYLTIVYKLFGPSIIIARMIKALLSSFSCVLVYKLASRVCGESVGRMAGLMMALMPNLIIYCGFHLKETEMIFLEVAFLERADFLFRSKRFRFWDILVPSLLAGSLFTFRTVLGAASVLVFATGAILSRYPSMKRGSKRAVIIAWGFLCLIVFSGGTIATEIEGYWQGRNENVELKRAQQTIRGNKWAKYATGTVMAPMAFVLPFATMVNVDEQYGQQEKSGGNYVRNFMGFFALLAIYEAFRRKKWRDFVLIGAFVIAYLAVIASSGYSNSERFLLPALPGLIIMWAYGVSTLRAKTYRLLTPWCFVVVLMECAWAYFKLGSRGLF